MNVLGSGLISIIIYAISSEGFLQDNTIMTENNLDILTESSVELLTET